MQKLRPVDLDTLNAGIPGTLMAATGLRFTSAGWDFIEAQMPVDERTHQPYGVLHGGASAALAETLGSVGSMLACDPEKFRCYGIELNCNHISAVRDGFVTGTARPLHLGRSTHVWDIRITTEDGKLVCVSRLTVAVVPVA